MIAPISTRLALITGIVLTIATVASLPIYSYEWHLALHIAGAIVFLGNIIVTAAWMILADRSGEPTVLAFASRSVGRADAMFTAPGSLLVLLNGLALTADRWGGWSGFLDYGWIVTSLLLFAASGAVWGLFLLRYQFRMIELSANVEETGPLPPEYFTLLRRWYAAGTVAAILPVIALMIMIWKPGA